MVLTAYLLADTPRLGNFAGQFIPPDRKEEADQLQEKLAGNGVEAALVRVER